MVEHNNQIQLDVLYLQIPLIKNQLSESEAIARWLFAYQVSERFTKVHSIDAFALALGITGFIGTSGWSKRKRKRRKEKVRLDKYMECICIK